MARMVVIYKTPIDPAAFDKHYFDVHIPLAKHLPGLKRYEVSKGPIVALAGAADRRILAPDDKDVQMFLFEDQIAYCAT